MRAPRIALLLCLVVVVGAASAIRIAAVGAAEPDDGESAADDSPAPTIYKWIDEHGVAHYTTDRDRIPRELRNRVGKLGPPDAAVRRPPAAASAPPSPARSTPDFDEGVAPVSPTPPAPTLDEGEKWAVRDRSFEGSPDAWNEGDPYGSLSPPAPGEDQGVVSAAEQAERRQRLEDLDEQIASLQTDIADSEEKLKALLVIPVPEGGGPLAMADDPTFREAANRLPKLLSDLRALEDERAQLRAP